MGWIAGPGCVVFLIDESAAMAAVVDDVVASGQRAVKTNAERVATAVNSLLGQLARGPDFDVAVVGYQTDAADQVHVGSRWGGSLAGRDFVGTGELAAAPLRMETRTRKMPAPDGIGPPREESVEFPVWYAPALGVKSPQIAAYQYCRDLLTRWAAESGPDVGAPLVIHITAGASGDGNPQRAVDELLQLSTPGGPPLVLMAHMAPSREAATLLYPSSHVYLTLGSARDLFRRVSPLPQHLVTALKDAKVPVNPAARGLIYNAKIIDVIRMFGLVSAHTKDWPSKGAVVEAAEEPVAGPAAEAAAPSETEAAPSPGAAEKAMLLVLLLDRSVEDPFSGNVKNPCAVLQEHANDLLQQIGKLPDGSVEAAIASYGLDAGGQVDVRAGFDGPLAGRTTVAQGELTAGAIRVDEVEEQISNGVGGLITVRRKKPIYFELEPTAAAPTAEAFAAVARVVADWCGQHQAASLAPVVLHLTRGRAEPAEIEQATGQLHEITAASPVVLYHLVATETPHKSLAYPDTLDEMAEPSLQKLWELSSPLLGRQRLAAENPAIKPESRGIVVNGRFDRFLDEIKHVLAE
jgi:hypothetical protein